MFRPCDFVLETMPARDADRTWIHSTSTHQRLRKLAAGDGPVGQDSSSSHSSECSICLLAVSVRTFTGRPDVVTARF